MAKSLSKPKHWGLKVLFGVICAAIFAYSVYHYLSFESTAVHGKGKVTSVKHESKATGRRGNRVSIERPVVHFVVAETQREVTTAAQVTSSGSFEEGEEVDVEYDPQRPEETVRIASGLTMLEIAFGVLGAFMIYLGTSEKLRWTKAIKGGA